ncbi:methyltransferase family protein [Motilibacter rhizosphaerae]|uniref:Methyltransferase family protein n=1 Tax=Motilibacter rhizosphaerae TaxID=598652 RepID=A0A4Q7NT61_9ACTN|nr:class I SAM-dependent methyltransferase [Motilibacter rhizosphaerae]RZS90184.1 methyltransferase family protein [Motilibacter rhizosphaerae]
MSAPLPPLTANAWLRWDVVSRLLPDPPLDVLEVGCGQGAAGARLAGLGRYVGLEPDAASYAVAVERVGAAGGEVRHGSVEQLREGEEFDLVCAFEVLEHIEDDAVALASWVERIRPGGSLLLSVPAHAARFAAADQLVGHFRRYDPPALRLLLRRAGLDEVDLRLYGAPVGYALEAARNAISARKLASAGSMEERSGHSGRYLQPQEDWQSTAIRLGTVPFRLLQRAFPGTGPGIVVRARKPLAP